MIPLSEHGLQDPYFWKDTYLKSSASKGTLMSQTNTRLLVLPEELVTGFHQALEYEAGRAFSIIAYTCGKKWGLYTTKRWEKEWRTFYQMAPHEADFAFFEAWLQACFVFHGWGRIEMDFSMERDGLLQYHLTDSVLAALNTSLEEPYVCGLFTGLLAHATGWLCGRELDALEIACVKNGAERCSFVVAAPEVIGEMRQMQMDGANAQRLLQAMRLH